MTRATMRVDGFNPVPFGYRLRFQYWLYRVGYVDHRVIQRAAFSFFLSKNQVLGEVCSSPARSLEKQGESTPGVGQLREIVYTQYFDRFLKSRL